MSGLQRSIGEGGGPARHIPVMLDEVLSVVKPGPGQTVVDGTFGAGGYSRSFLDAGAMVIGIDRDPNAIRDGQHAFSEYGRQLDLIKGEFGNLDALATSAGHAEVDAVVLDIGVSSMQLDGAARGFSFRRDGPLDMRMAQSGVSAADVVNQARQPDLTRIIGILGEEKKASRVSAAIVRAREAGPLKSTLELSEVVAKAVGHSHKDRIHPATRTFQALRMFVNRELEQLAQALFAAERLLRAGGRLAVVTFHSLEDRLVKRFFNDRSNASRGSRHQPEVASSDPSFSIEKKGLHKPSELECESNPRARSAKLRWGARTETAARAADMSIFQLPDLVPLHFFAGQAETG